jgi:beta-phosphoglucomutase-like phosphatase (HAD superfamily)
VSLCLRGKIKMIQTVIFDMDGVIVDTEPVHRYAYFQQFSELNIHVTEEQFTSFTGNSTRNVFQKVKKSFWSRTGCGRFNSKKKNYFQ